MTGNILSNDSACYISTDSRGPSLWVGARPSVGLSDGSSIRELTIWQMCF